MLLPANLLLLLCALAACEKKPDPGFLLVNAPSEGAYEIYRIANESPLQFVSEQTGQLNAPVGLAPGSYLVLGDCSSETVTVYPGETVTLAAHRLEFVPPRQPGAMDSFAIQCSRSDKTRSRQLLANRYALNVIHGKRDLLVGMVPMHIDFAQLAPDGKPMTKSYKLSALQVADYEGNSQETSYFVSPVAELISVTKYQRFGHWEYLLQGQYIVEVNGTRMQVELAEGEERVVKPALLRVSTSPEVDLEQPVRVKGSPWLVEINNGHWLNFNETYPVLPGPAEVKISGSTRSVQIELAEGQSFELQARSVTVDTGCDEHDVACLGDKDVSLALEGETYPFVESLSDMPILYIDEQLPVLVGVAGSRRHPVSAVAERARQDAARRLREADAPAAASAGPGDRPDARRLGQRADVGAHARHQPGAADAHAADRRHLPPRALPEPDRGRRRAEQQQPRLHDRAGQDDRARFPRLPEREKVLRVPQETRRKPRKSSHPPVTRHPR